MANMVDALENLHLDGIVGVTSLYSSGIAMAVFTADPGDAGSVVNEMTGNGYERKLLAGLFSAATGTDGTTSNTSIIDFVTATGDWPEATHIGFMKSDVEGTDDMIVRLPLVSPITILNTQVFSYAVGKCTVIAK